MIDDVFRDAGLLAVVLEQSIHEREIDIPMLDVLLLAPADEVVVRDQVLCESPVTDNSDNKRKSVYSHIFEYRIALIRQPYLTVIVRESFILRIAAGLLLGFVRRRMQRQAQEDEHLVLL